MVKDAVSMIGDVNPDARMERENLSNPERALALHYAPRHLRDGLAAIWRLDARMQALFVGAREPALAEIKLAWWQERLNALNHGPAPPEPLLQDLRSLVSQGRAGPNGLVPIAAAWRELFGERPWGTATLDAYASARGRGLIAAAATALDGVAGEAQLVAGEAWALFDLAGSLPPGMERTEITAASRARFGSAGRSAWPRALRPAGTIVALARADAATDARSRIGSPGRIARMAWHAVSGR